MRASHSSCNGAFDGVACGTALEAQTHGAATVAANRQAAESILRVMFIALFPGWMREVCGQPGTVKLTVVRSTA
jgi:hypothetical protein